MTLASHTRCRTRPYPIQERFFIRKFGLSKTASSRALASCVMQLPSCRQRSRVRGLVLPAAKSWRDSSDHAGSVEQIEVWAANSRSSPRLDPVAVAVKRTWLGVAELGGRRVQHVVRVSALDRYVAHDPITPASLYPWHPCYPWFKFSTTDYTDGTDICGEHRAC